MKPAPGRTAATPSIEVSQVGRISPSTPRRTVRARDGPLQLRERAARDDPAVVDDRQRLAQGLCRLHLVGREDDRAALVAQLDEGVAQQREVDRVEPGERLVHEQDVGAVQDRGDELDLLLVALAELLGPPIGESGMRKRSSHTVLRSCARRQSTRRTALAK